MIVQTPVQDRDRGAVLPLALILTVVFGVLAVAIAGYVATALRSTAVTQGRVDRVADVEAGLRSSLRNFEFNEACPIPGDVPGSYNASTVRVVTCDRDNSIDLGDSGQQYSLVVTDLDNSNEPAFDRTLTGGANQEVEISGPVFISREVKEASPQAVTAIHRVEVERDNCEGYESDPIVWLGGVDRDPPELSVDAPECETKKWSDASPIPPSIGPLPANASPPDHKGPPTCHVFQPGTYSGNVTTSHNSANYFRPGIYVFDGALTLRNETLFGHPGSVTASGGNGNCISEQQQDVEASGNSPDGVVIVLQGNGHIVLDSGDYFEFNGRQIGDRRFSVIAAPPDLGWTPASTRPVTAPVIVSDHPGVDFVFRGEVWVPGGYIEVGRLSSQQAGRGFRGGFTMARLTFVSSGFSIGDDAFLIALGGVEEPRRYRLVVTAEDERSSTSGAAVVNFFNDDLTLESMRICEFADCVPPAVAP